MSFQNIAQGNRPEQIITKEEAIARLTRMGKAGLGYGSHSSVIIASKGNVRWTRIRTDDPPGHEGHISVVSDGAGGRWHFARPQFAAAKFIELEGAQ